MGSLSWKIHYALFLVSSQVPIPDFYHEPIGLLNIMVLGKKKKKEKKALFMQLMSWRLCKEISYLNQDHLFFMQEQK